MQEKEECLKVLVRNPAARGHLKDLGVYKGILLKLMLKE